MTRDNDDELRNLVITFCGVCGRAFMVVRLWSCVYGRAFMVMRLWLCVYGRAFMAVRMKKSLHMF